VARVGDAALKRRACVCRPRGTRVFFPPDPALRCAWCWAIMSPPRRGCTMPIRTAIATRTQYSHRLRSAGLCSSVLQRGTSPSPVRAACRPPARIFAAKPKWQKALGQRRAALKAP